MTGTKLTQEGDWELEKIRRKTLIVLGVATGLVGVGAFSIATVASVLGATFISKSLSGVPFAAFGVGLAATPIPLSSYMARHGRRPGLAIGHGLGAIGSALGFVGVINESVVLLLVGMTLLGPAYASALLSRYAAADIATKETRGRVIGYITWSLVIGAVAGPNLLGLGGSIAEDAGFARLSAPFVMSAVCAGAASLVIWFFLKPDPLHVARSLSPAPLDAPSGTQTVRQLLVIKEVRAALVAMATVQLVMMGVMTATAVHITSHQHGLTFVGVVLSAHFFGMFGMSPVAGWISDHVGRTGGLMAGLGTVIAGGAVAAVAPSAAAAILISLLLIGVGWNINIVSASALLTEGVPDPERPKMQGAADFMNGVMSVVASAGSGLLLTAIGFSGMGAASAALLLVPVAVALFMKPKPVGVES